MNPEKTGIDPGRKQELSDLAKKIGINLSKINVSFFHQALTHKSYVNELKSHLSTREADLSNQRLEFLGDAVLGMVVAAELYQKYPKENEGVLTKKKSMAVCEPTLAEIGRKLNIGNFLMLGKGEKNTGGKDKSSNIADALESIIGSIYLSAGYPEAQQFILRHWQPYINENRQAQFSIDHKSVLQEKLVKIDNTRPEYRVLSTSGPEHNKTFEIGLFIRGEQVSKASAQSRKKAEQKAALEYLNQLPKQALSKRRQEPSGKAADSK